MNGATAPIHRHRTAMVRHTLSQPVLLLVQHAVIRPGVTVFDYGCGQGDDLRALAAAGVEARGWDPHFAPEVAWVASNVVNLGFVLNVIEDERERRRALADAWSLTTTALAVSTMIAGQVPTEGLRPLADGYVTSRGTFQKYFAHSELRALIADTIGTDPVPAAPGIFFAFRHPEDQEEYLLRRRMDRRIGTSAYRSTRQRPERAARPELEQRIPDALSAIADLCRMRGRAPIAEEIPLAAAEQLAHERVSLQRALDAVLGSVLAEGEMDAAGAAMREDLLVHYALARLNHSSTAARPGSAMVRDVRAHFGSQREVATAATDYLMALADESAVRAAFAKAAEQGTAAIDHRGRLLLVAKRRDALPGTLRVYLGCAAYLAGEPDDRWLVRVDAASRAVLYLPVERWTDAFPTTAGATAIDLQRQTVRSLATRRVLLARSAVGERASTAQRRREQTERVTRGLAEGVLLVKEQA